MRIYLGRLDILMTHQVHYGVEGHPLHYELASKVMAHVIPRDARYLGFDKDPVELFF